MTCDPVLRDWTADRMISVYGAEIMPGSDYVVQLVHVGCPDLENPACYSPAVTRNTAKYGDTWPLFDGDDTGAPQPDFNDIAAMARKFQALGAVCIGGANDGLPCQVDADCPVEPTRSRRRSRQRVICSRTSSGLADHPGLSIPAR